MNDVKTDSPIQNALDSGFTVTRLYDHPAPQADAQSVPIIRINVIGDKFSAVALPAFFNQATSLRDGEHDLYAHAHAGEVVSLKCEVSKWRGTAGRLTHERNTLSIQLSEANDLLRKMADIDLTAANFDHEHWQYLLGEASLQLATSEQPKAMPPEALSFEFKHPVSNERRTITVTKAEVADGMEDGLYEKLVAQVCQCEPVGETNVVDCACDEYVHDFDLVVEGSV